MALLNATSVHISSLSYNSHGLNKEGRVPLSVLPQGRVLGYSLSPNYYKRKNPRAQRISSDLGADAAVKPAEEVLSKKSFPRSFVFGAGTSSYQIEGAWNEDGKGPSIWDHFCHTFPERIKNRSNGDVASNSYHMFEEDVKMLKAMRMDAYRFSICWPRILPKGSLQGGINPDGIKYYNNLINKLLENGIQPYVTLFHWEVPQALEEEYGGFLSRRIVKDFKDFAGVCFKEFGDRVKHWFTLNEPYVFCSNAYGVGKHAPGRCSSTLKCAVPTGNSLAEPYIAGHNQILAHAEAARLYRDKYQVLQKGQIGIALVSMGYEPYESKSFDEQAQNRSIDFHLGWFLEPLIHGDYPFNMRALVGDRLQFFTKEEERLITGSYDIIGLNYYTSRFADGIAISPDFHPEQNKEDIYADHKTIGINGHPIGPKTGTDWIFSYPDGLKNLLMIIKDRYNNPPVYITENGMGDVDEGDLSMEDALKDTVRCEYLKVHIAKVREAITEGANVKGHFTWSLLDNFEWHQGYTHRFGLIYVDYKDNYKRHMKDSAKWFAEFNGKSKLAR